MCICVASHNEREGDVVGVTSGRDRKKEMSNAAVRNKQQNARPRTDGASRHTETSEEKRREVKRSEEKRREGGKEKSTT